MIKCLKEDKNIFNTFCWTKSKKKASKYYKIIKI